LGFVERLRTKFDWLVELIVQESAMVCEEVAVAVKLEGIAGAPTCVGVSPETNR
jgi:hypothetical protein